MQAVETVGKIYLTYAEAERLTGLSRWTIHRAVKGGELEASGSGRLTRFHIDTLDKWMKVRS